MSILGFIFNTISTFVCAGLSVCRSVGPKSDILHKYSFDLKILT